jgi:hypothetical protein
VQFRLADGRTHEAKADDFKLGSSKLPVGATLPVMYDPRNPADVRAEMSWERVKILLIMLAVGIVCLALTFGGPLAALYAWAFRGRTSARIVREAQIGPGARLARPRRNHPAASGQFVIRITSREPFGATQVVSGVIVITSGLNRAPATMDQTCVRTNARAP